MKTKNNTKTGLLIAAVTLAIAVTIPLVNAQQSQTNEWRLVCVKDPRTASAPPWSAGAFVISWGGYPAGMQWVSDPAGQVGGGGYTVTATTAGSDFQGQWILKGWNAAPGNSAILSLTAYTNYGENPSGTSGNFLPSQGPLYQMVSLTVVDDVPTVHIGADSQATATLWGNNEAPYLGGANFAVSWSGTRFVVTLQGWETLIPNQFLTGAMDEWVFVAAREQEIGEPGNPGCLWDEYGGPPAGWEPNE